MSSAAISVFQAFKSLFSFMPVSTQDRDERFLADSVDIYDLERRMRQIDSGRHHLASIGAYGLLMR